MYLRPKRDLRLRGRTLPSRALPGTLKIGLLLRQNLGTRKLCFRRQIPASSGIVFPLPIWRDLWMGSFLTDPILLPRYLLFWSWYTSQNIAQLKLLSRERTSCLCFVFRHHHHSQITSFRPKSCLNFFRQFSPLLFTVRYVLCGS